MIFDFHARLVPRPEAGRRLLDLMDQYGIAGAAICAGGMIDAYRLARHILTPGRVEAEPDNDAVLAAARRSDGRLVPFYFADPRRNSYADRAGDFRGLEISPAVHGVPLTDPDTLALVEVAAAHRHPVYVVPLGHPGMAARDLAMLATKFPEIPFVLGHCGFHGADADAIDRVAEVPNVVAELSGCFTRTAMIALERLGPDRVVFGTEFPLQHPGVELAKLDALELSPDQRQQVAWRTAHRLLGEDSP